MSADVPSLGAALGAFLVALFSVGLRGLQHKAVAYDQYWLMAGISFMIVVADALTVTFVVKQGLLITIPAGLGAAVGIVASTYSHNRWLRRKD